MPRAGGVGCFHLPLAAIFTDVARLLEVWVELARFDGGLFLIHAEFVGEGFRFCFHGHHGSRNPRRVCPLLVECDTSLAVVPAEHFAHAHTAQTKGGIRQEAWSGFWRAGAVSAVYENLTRPPRHIRPRKRLFICQREETRRQ